MTGVTLVMDGRAAVPTHYSGYYFDFSPVYERCVSMRDHPERVALMCDSRVRALAPGELMVPHGQGFYLIVQTRLGVAADALANEISSALMRLFFGSDSLAGLASLFRAVAPEEMRDANILVPVEQATPTPMQSSVSASKRIGTTGQESLPDLLSQFAQTVLAGPEKLQAGFLPMINIQREAPSIYMCGPVLRRNGRMVFGPAALKDCAPKDRPALDKAMLEYSMGFARQIVPKKITAAISASVSYETLAWSRGRQQYQQALRDLDAVNNPFLVVKIDDVPSGTPVSRLAEIVATVRPFVKRVVLHLPGCDMGLMQSGQIGAAALCATLPARATPPAIVRFATWLHRAALGQQALSCVDGVEDVNALPLLRAAGIRFAAGSANDGSVHVSGLPMHTQLVEFAA